MQPFFKKIKEAGAAGPVESVKREPDTEAEFDAMESAAEDLMNAVHSKDVKAVASALKAAFLLADSEPHEEGPHDGI